MTSAMTGQGIAELAHEILQLLGGDSGAQQESGFLTNVRQQKLVQDCTRCARRRQPPRSR